MDMKPEHPPTTSRRLGCKGHEQSVRCAQRARHDNLAGLSSANWLMFDLSLPTAPLGLRAATLKYNWALAHERALYIYIYIDIYIYIASKRGPTLKRSDTKEAKKSKSKILRRRSAIIGATGDNY